MDRHEKMQPNKRNKKCKRDKGRIGTRENSSTPELPWPDMVLMKFAERPLASGAFFPHKHSDSQWESQIQRVNFNLIKSAILEEKLRKTDSNDTGKTTSNTGKTINNNERQLQSALSNTKPITVESSCEDQDLNSNQQIFHMPTLDGWQLADVVDTRQESLNSTKQHGGSRVRKDKRESTQTGPNFTWKSAESLKRPEKPAETRRRKKKKLREKTRFSNGGKLWMEALTLDADGESYFSDCTRIVVKKDLNRNICKYEESELNWFSTNSENPEEQRRKRREKFRAEFEFSAWKEEHPWNSAWNDLDEDPVSNSKLPPPPLPGLDDWGAISRIESPLDTRFLPEHLHPDTRYNSQHLVQDVRYSSHIPNSKFPPPPLRGLDDWGAISRIESPLDTRFLPEHLHPNMRCYSQHLVQDARYTSQCLDQFRDLDTRFSPEHLDPETKYNSQHSIPTPGPPGDINNNTTVSIQPGEGSRVCIQFDEGGGGSIKPGEEGGGSLPPSQGGDGSPCAGEKSDESLTDCDDNFTYDMEALDYD